MLFGIKCICCKRGITAVRGIKKMRTLKSWVRETNVLACIVLLFYALVCAIVVRKQEPVEIYAGDHTASFRVNAVFIYAMAVEFCARLHTAVYTEYTEHALVGKTPTLRLPMLLFSFPAVNAAVLVGVVDVHDVWGIFAVVATTLLMLCCAWMLSIASVHSFAAGGIAILAAALYLATWFLGVTTSVNGSTFAVVCYIVSAAGLMLTYTIAVLVNGNRLRQEIFMSCSTLALYILGFAMYASSIDEKTIIAPWSAFAVSVVLLLVFCMISMWRLPKNNDLDLPGPVETHRTNEDVHAPFINAEIDSDEEELVVNSENSTM